MPRATPCSGRPTVQQSTILSGRAQRGIDSLLRRLARRSLKPQLNQIRTWVRQGRTDAWIAHQLEVSVGDIRSFKREHELVPDDAPGATEDGPAPAVEELDLRAEDDALVAAALEAEQEAAEEEPDEPDTDSDDEEGDGDADSDSDDKPKRRRRGKRGGRGRRR